MKGKWPHYKLEPIVYFNPHSLSFLPTETGFEVGGIGSGFKYLNLDYIVQYFQKFSGGGMTWGLSFLRCVFPRVLTRLSVNLPTGMLALAHRNTTNKAVGITY